jgi:hypothetical protein
MRRRGIEIAALTLLLVLLDQLYRLLHPEVNLVRASLVGATALAALVPLARLGGGRIDPLRGALTIFASAFGSVLLIQAGVLTSRSSGSAIMHVALLAAAFLALDRAHTGSVGARRPTPERQRRAR